VIAPEGHLGGMPGSKKVDFYGGKPSSLPRFVYRRLAAALKANPESRGGALDAAIEELLTGANPDLRKFKFTLPALLQAALRPEEVDLFTARTAQRREHAGRLKMVYPHVSDEFSLDPAFLLSVLDMGEGPRVAAPGRFFTIGSCFARNIAEFLSRNGHPAKTFALAEDLNSPISNAFIFDILRRDPADRMATLAMWVRRIFPELDEASAAEVARQRLVGLTEVAASLREADCVVLTLGNVVDFFRDDAGADLPLAEKIFPKFVAMPGDEDIAVRSNAAARLKKQGATLRLASYRETQEAITACIMGIRRETAAPIVVTLSPVPVDSVIGLAGDLKSAIEVDCVSKARLRSAFDEAAAELRAAYGPIHYFPSFEIVRWIGPMLSIPSFGYDDAASRHVSSPILDAICQLFLNDFVTWRPAQPHGLDAAAGAVR
jgi:GSCFA family